MSGSTPLCAEEREIISRELSQEKSARYIAKPLGRHHSTIAREISRNGGEQRLLGTSRSTFSGISPHFRPGRHRLDADEYRHEMTVRFATWNEVHGHGRLITTPKINPAATPMLIAPWQGSTSKSISCATRTPPN